MEKWLLRWSQIKYQSWSEINLIGHQMYMEKPDLKVLHSQGWNISFKKIHVSNGHGANSQKLETCQLANHFETLDSNRQALEQDTCFHGSVVASVKCLPNCTRNFWLLTLTGPSVFNATGNKEYEQSLCNVQQQRFFRLGNQCTMHN